MLTCYDGDVPDGEGDRERGAMKDPESRTTGVGSALIERIGLGTFALGARSTWRITYQLVYGCSRLSAIAVPDGSRAHEITLSREVLLLVSGSSWRWCERFQRGKERRKKAIGGSVNSSHD